jgi:hypothetical protein
MDLRVANRGDGVRGAARISGERVASTARRWCGGQICTPSPRRHRNVEDRTPPKHGLPRAARLRAQGVVIIKHRVVAAARQREQVAELGLLAQEFIQPRVNSLIVEPGLEEGPRGLLGRRVEALHGLVGGVARRLHRPPRLGDARDDVVSQQRRGRRRARALDLEDPVLLQAAPARGRVLLGLRLGREGRAEAARLLAPPLRLLAVRELLGLERRRVALEEYTFLLRARAHRRALRLVHDLGRRQPQGAHARRARGRRPQRRRGGGERRCGKPPHVRAGGTRPRPRQRVPQKGGRPGRDARHVRHGHTCSGWLI